MTFPTTSTFDQHLQRHGDDLYRLALLLAPDVPQAEAALVRAAPALAPADARDEAALVVALLHALPPEKLQRRQRVPAWAQRSPLLVAFAGLPRMQRLALALTLLHGWDAERAAPLFDGDAARVQREARDGLLAVSSQQSAKGNGPEQRTPDTGRRTPDITLLDPANAPTECQPTRAMLALTAVTGERDPAQRGHLAFCPACRAAEQAWQQLVTGVEVAVRAALRDEHLPEPLAERMRLTASSAPNATRSDVTRWLRWAVPLAVVALVAVLVFPRGQAVDTPTMSADVPNLLPKEQVARALERLYAPPATVEEGAVWHGRWQIRWVFGDGTFATLNADAWRDPQSSRHRVQLAHEAGGGPYEFELADGDNNALYAVTPNYGGQLYPLSLFDASDLNARLDATVEQQRALLNARLESGAWSIAGSYLRQAQTVDDLRSWGRQRAADGTPLDLISYRGASPLGLPPGVPNAPSDPTTILLAISARDGTLREVSEVTGPAGAEQTRQTTWRFVSDEWISAPDATRVVFNERQAWNGAGRFPERTRPLTDPTLPFARPDSFLPITMPLYDRWRWRSLPTVVPPGTTTAALLTAPYSADRILATYSGPGRRLIIQQFSGDADASREETSQSEQISDSSKLTKLYPAAPQSYTAIIETINQETFPRLVLVHAMGYSRAELLDVLNSLGPMTLEGFNQQIDLFTSPVSHSPEVHAALRDALAPSSKKEGVRHTVVRMFTRQGRFVSDPLPDPYHQRLFQGRPPNLIQEAWSKNRPDGMIEQKTIIRDERQRYEESFITPHTTWQHDLVKRHVIAYEGDKLGAGELTFGQWLVLQMMQCSGVQLAAQDTVRVLFVVEREWQQQKTCMNPGYGDMLREQQRDPARASTTLYDNPFISDMFTDSTEPVAPDAPLITSIFLRDDGQPKRAEVRAGDGSQVLLKSWELVTDEHVLENQVPPSTFSPQPPATLISDEYISNRSSESSIHTITITEARTLVSQPLWTLPLDPQYKFARVETGKRRFSNRLGSPDFIGDAVDRGFAVRLRYTLPQRSAQSLLHIVQGDARDFGDFLRARAWWNESTPVELTIGNRVVQGWQVRGEGSYWTLFELDGTLIAADVYTATRSVAPLPVREILQKLTQ